MFVLKLKSFLKIIIFSFTILAVFSTDVKACNSKTTIAAFEKTRAYQNPDIGFSFKLPFDYRIIRNNNGSLFVMDSMTYEEYRRIISNNISTEQPQECVSIDIIKISENDKSLYDLVIEAYPYIEMEGFNFRNSTLANESSLTYLQKNLLYDTTTFYVSLLTPDKKYLITISGSLNSSELNLALSSFQFN